MVQTGRVNGASGLLEQQLPIHMIIKQFQEPLVFGLLREVQTKITAPLFQRSVLGEVAETGHVKVVANLPKHLIVAGTAHLIK